MLIHIIIITIIIRISFLLEYFGLYELYDNQYRKYDRIGSYLERMWRSLGLGGSTQRDVSVISIPRDKFGKPCLQDKADQSNRPLFYPEFDCLGLFLLTQIQIRTWTGGSIHGIVQVLSHVRLSSICWWLQLLYGIGYILSVLYFFLKFLKMRFVSIGVDCEQLASYFSYIVIWDIHTIKLRPGYPEMAIISILRRRVSPAGWVNFSVSAPAYFLATTITYCLATWTRELSRFTLCNCLPRITIRTKTFITSTVRFT